MAELDQAEDYQNIIQCLNECRGNVSHARNLCFERYGKEFKSETILGVIRLHGDVNLNENYIEDADADMPRTTENIIIKEEIEIGEECILEPKDSKYNLELIPVVYTTRLDDMPIFEKNFASLTVDDIVSNVILESKPKLTKHLNDKTKRILPTFNGHPFFKLVAKIRELNELSIVQEDDDDNLNVLPIEQDKDDNNLNVLSIVQDDDDDYDEEENIPLKLISSKDVDLNINIYKRKYRAKAAKPLKEKKQRVVNHSFKNKKPQAVNQCKPCTVLLTPSHKVCLYKGKHYVIYDKQYSHRILPFVKGVLYKIDYGCYIEFMNLKTKSSEVYIFDKEGLFSRTFDGLEFDVVRCYKGLQKFVLRVVECCWFHREYVIKSLVWSKAMDKNVVTPRFSILRKPHSCQSGRCNCCCKVQIIEDDDIEEIPVEDSIEESAQTVACQLLRLFNSFDKEASTSCVTKNKRTSDNNAKTTYAKDLKGTKDRLGIQILKNYSDMTEFYELRSNGNVLKHIEIMSKYLHTSNNFRRAMKLNADSDKEFCCWRKRDAMLRTFEFRYTLITQFIRPRHPCPPGNCICCCKPNLPKKSLKVNDLTRLQFAQRHAFKYTNIIKQRRKFLAKPKNMKILEFDNMTSDLQGNINAEFSDQSKLNNKPVDLGLHCNELVDFDLFIPGDIIDKTIDLTVTEKNEKSSVGTKRPSSNKVSQNRAIGETVKAFIAEKNVSKKRLVEKTSPKKVLNNPNNTLNASVASPLTQELASRPQVPTQPPSILSNILQQPRPPLRPQHPRPSHIEQNIIAPAQSNVVSPPNNSSPALNPLINTPLLQDTQEPTVNSIVTSILQRFRDVRLIITPDGNVSAELNTPMQNLTTPELQILFKILTHAKEQVQQLKAAGHLNSNQKHVFNPWPSNLESNSNLTQTPGDNTTPVIIQNTPTAPVIIANTDQIASATHATASSSNVFTSSKIMMNKENNADGRSRNDVFQCYTNLSALKMKEYLTSCRSYMNDVKFAPKIGNVFTLNPTAVQSYKTGIKSKNTKKSEKNPNPKTIGVKRKGNKNPRSDTKKLKTIEVIETIELDYSVKEKTPLQPNINAIPVTDPVDKNDRMPTPVLFEELDTPYVIPVETVPVIDSNQEYLEAPDTIPSSVPPNGVPCITLCPLINNPTSETPTNENDCILGF